MRSMKQLRSACILGTLNCVASSAHGTGIALFYYVRGKEQMRATAVKPSELPNTNRNSYFGANVQKRRSSSPLTYQVCRSVRISAEGKHIEYLVYILVHSFSLPILENPGEFGILQSLLEVVLVLLHKILMNLLVLVDLGQIGLDVLFRYPQELEQSAHLLVMILR